MINSISTSHQWSRPSINLAVEKARQPDDLGKATHRRHLFMVPIPANMGVEALREPGRDAFHRVRPFIHQKIGRGGTRPYHLWFRVPRRAKIGVGAFPEPQVSGLPNFVAYATKFGWRFMARVHARKRMKALHEPLGMTFRWSVRTSPCRQNRWPGCPLNWEVGKPSRSAIRIDLKINAD